MREFSELVIKDMLKEHLNVNVERIDPNAFANGYIKISIYWDNDLISESKQEIVRKFF